ncbi:MAG: serine/threonine-protein kinase [Myxococcota bacterium]
MFHDSPDHRPTQQERSRDVGMRITAPQERDAVRIGRFALLEQIGAGSMGEVFAAYDDQLDRRVAIKLLSRRRGLPRTARDRLIREARALARLSHPHVVTVYDAGVHDGEVFVAMEFVRGQTLDTWLTVRRRTWGEILEVFIALGEGLAAMHEHRLVHRDFKPANAMVDDKGCAQLIDFGLVKHVESDDTLATAEPESADAPDGMSLTRTGHLTGTLLYMAPELLRREAATVHSDQFAFCAALFEALYRCVPFGSEQSEVHVERVLAGALTMPDPSATRDVPDELLAVVTRGLSHEPEDRWASLAELLTVLRGLRDGYDAELAEPDALRRRSRLLMLVIAAGTTVFGGLIALSAADAVVHSLTTQVVVDGTIAALVGLGAVVLRSRWRPHRRSREMVGLLLLVTQLYFAQSLVGLVAGRTLYDCLLSGLVSVTLIFFFAAPMLVSPLRWASLWCAACTVTMILDPAGVVVYFLAANVGTGLIGAVFVPRQPVEPWVRTAAYARGRGSSLPGSRGSGSRARAPTGSGARLSAGSSVHTPDRGPGDRTGNSTGGGTLVDSESG